MLLLGGAHVWPVCLQALAGTFTISEALLAPCATALGLLLTCVEVSAAPIGIQTHSNLACMAGLALFFDYE